MQSFILAAIKDRENSAKVLVDNIDCRDECKAYLSNNPEKCAAQVVEIIGGQKPDLLIVFGQKALMGEIYVEIIAKIECDSFETNYDYNALYGFLKDKGYKVKVSQKPGSHLANRVYAEGLTHIAKTASATKYLFIHIPILISEPELYALAHAFESFFKKAADF